MILGCDAAGLDEDGNEVRRARGDLATRLDGRRDPRPEAVAALRAHQGTFAEQGRRAPPQRGAQARLAVVRGGRLPADRLAHGVPDALRPGRPQGRRLGAGAGRRRRRRHRADRAGPGRRARVLATSRDEAKRARALEIGAHEVFESGARLPEKVDAVMETVGRATWSHSIRALRPGGTIVTQRHDVGAEPRRRRADPDLLPAAAGDRLDDGHPRRAGRAGPDARRDRHPAADRPDAADGPTPARASPRWPRATSFGKIVFTR